MLAADKLLQSNEAAINRGEKELKSTQTFSRHEAAIMAASR